jgi:hypothetical protein
VQVQYPLDYTDPTCVDYVEHAKHALEIYQALHGSIDDQTPAAQKEIGEQYLGLAKATYKRALENQKIQDDEAEEEDVAMTNADASTEETEDSGDYTLDELQAILSSDDEDPDARPKPAMWTWTSQACMTGRHKSRLQLELRGAEKDMDWTATRRRGHNFERWPRILVVVSSLHRTVLHATWARILHQTHHETQQEIGKDKPHQPQAYHDM